MKKIVKKAVKIFIFLLIVNLPFLTMSSMLSLDVFLDSFENPEQYIFIENDQQIIESNVNEGDYILIQKASHPSFEVNEKDIIIYYEYNSGLVCNKVYQTHYLGATRRYYIENNNGEITDNPVHDAQVIGKVINFIDDTIWNQLSIKLWDASINNLNFHAVFSD